MNLKIEELLGEIVPEIVIESGILLQALCTPCNTMLTNRLRVSWKMFLGLDASVVHYLEVGGFAMSLWGI